MIVDAQQRQLLKQLQNADPRPVPYAELQANGVHFPAAVISELELNGYEIERVHEDQHMIGVRLNPQHTTPQSA